MSILLLHLLPLVSLCYVNCAIFLAIRARRHLLTSSGRQRREMVVATVLTVIVLVFLICHSLKFFINFVELWAVIRDLDPQSVWGTKMNVVVSVSHLLITINCSTNFIIYCMKDPRFRDVISGCVKASFKFKHNNRPSPNIRIEPCSIGVERPQFRGVDHEISTLTPINRSPTLGTPGTPLRFSSSSPSLGATTTPLNYSTTRSSDLSIVSTNRPTKASTPPTQHSNKDAFDERDMEMTAATDDAAAMNNASVMDGEAAMELIPLNRQQSIIYNV